MSSKTYNWFLGFTLLADRKPHLGNFQLRQGDEIRQDEVRHSFTQVCADDLVKLPLEASKRLLRYRVIDHRSQHVREIRVFVVPRDICSCDVLVAEVGFCLPCAKRSFHGGQQTAVIL